MLCQLPQEACLAWRGGGWPGEIAGGSGDGSVLALFRSPQRPRWAFRVSENVDGCGGLHSGGGVVFIRGAGWVIFQLVPRESVAWRWAAVGFSFVYVFVPSFRLMEFLPIYRNICAPFDCYQVTGSICLIGAVALAAGVLLEKVRWGFLRRVLLGAFLLRVAVDVAPYARPFFQERAGRGVWRDFLEVQEFLKTAPESGRVYAFSGRFFYLMTSVYGERAERGVRDYAQNRAQVAIEVCRRRDEGVGGEESSAEEGE